MCKNTMGVRCSGGEKVGILAAEMWPLLLTLTRCLLASNSALIALACVSHTHSSTSHNRGGGGGGGGNSSNSTSRVCVGDGPAVQAVHW